MSIPLDRLYNFLDSLCDRDVLIYRFSPHGSKKPEDLLPLKNASVNYATQWYHNMTTPVMICHDQEPLQFDLYNQQALNAICSSMSGFPVSVELRKTMNLRGLILYHFNAYDYVLLCHSEQNSPELEKYTNHGFAGVYWWSHGIIARDWFRYAEHDPDLTYSADQITHDFLIYNRAWTGTREYRLKFAEHLVKNCLVKNCNTKFSAVDDQVHYTDHQWANPKFAINRTDLQQHFVNNTVDSGASADYDAVDYQTSGIEIVLETLFDDQRWHLTEKSLRPIACGKPFVLMATAGSLQYLRQYGFQTFDGLIDETYDTVKDPADRLQAVIAEMQRISQLPTLQKHALWTELNKIARCNQELFFSDAWQNKLIQEFVDNANNALEFVSQHRTAQHWKTLTSTMTESTVQNCRSTQDVDNLLKWLNDHVPAKKIKYQG
jgi:hypothetical protein